MYYPRFTKVVIYHFITKDKTISMRNRLFMHTAQDDCVLSTMKFVSKSEDCQVYRALLPEVMTNQKMRNSSAYKTYLAYDTGAATPKKARRFKKPAFPSKKRTLVTVEEEEPKPAKIVKKAPAKAARSKGIDLLLEAALLEEAQLTNSENQETNNDEEETDNEFVHIPPNYVPKDDETNEESNDVDEEEYGRIDKELYGNVNVRLTDAEQDDEGEEDANMTYVAHVQVEQSQEQTTGVQEESGPEIASVQGQYVVQATTTATPAIQNATTEVPPFSSSHSVSSNYTIPHTSPLLTIPVSMIPEHTVFNPSERVITTSATTTSSLLSLLFRFLQQSTPIPTPTTTEATTLTPFVLEFETLNVIHLRLLDLEKEVKELKNVDHSSALLSTIKSKVPNAVKEYLGTSLDDALYNMLQKHSTDIAKEHSVPAEIVKRLMQQYVPQKSIDEIWKIKMEHARKQQVPQETITSSDTTAL
ncbi:hypothetical protein Tco_0884020 [Tanacetum coccineum]